MATYTVEPHNVTDANKLIQSLSTRGEDNPIFTISTAVTVTTDILTEQQVIDSVNDAGEGALFANKLSRIEDVRNKSSELIGLGVLSGTQYVACDKVVTESYYTDYLYFNNNPAEISALKPYYINSITGVPVVMTTTLEISALVELCRARLQYVYVETGGELELTQQILAAPDQASLDAITDNRV